LLGGDLDELSIKSYLSNAMVSPKDSGLNLSGIDLSESTWTDFGFSFEGSDLSRSNLSSAVFAEINLSGADLSGAILTNASLAGTKLVHADLRGANLTACDVTDADFSNADLSGADLTDVDMEKAQSVEGALISEVKGLNDDQIQACLDRGAVDTVPVRRWSPEQQEAYGRWIRRTRPR
jgi:uncharacterized protein YjbI with pentapeptide repeats